MLACCAIDLKYCCNVSLFYLGDEDVDVPADAQLDVCDAGQTLVSCALRSCRYCGELGVDRRQ